MKSKIPLLPGESPIPEAPFVKIKEDKHCIPQHYLKFDHSVESVERLVLDIDYSVNYPIFVSSDPSSIYLQIGVVGFDNYRAKADQKGMKIVYGRKWRVEPQLPTSEVIQTAFLAILKAREHEVRELFKLEYESYVSTPFSNHHDLPLMAAESDLLVEQQNSAELTDVPAWLQDQLDKLKYDAASFQLLHVEQRYNGQWLIDIEIQPNSETQLPELANAQITLQLDQLTTNELYFDIMDKLLDLSRRHVEENFRYRGFARFSRHNNVALIGKLSSITRKLESERREDEFSRTFSEANYETDQTRVPKLTEGPLADKLRKQLSQLNIADGILPE
ncbi:hypothetical protein EYS14_18950 [Alteromonadaceae bacterium M269]|nr:hypothetical protein EYS14_18950 [Alteromonadaceae bacterium M269]